MWGRIVWLYKNILGEDRLTLNSLKEMINYTGKIRIRSLIFGCCDSWKNGRGKVGIRTIFFFFFFLAEVEKFELDKLATGFVSWLGAKWQVALWVYDGFEPYLMGCGRALVVL